MLSRILFFRCRRTREARPAGFLVNMGKTAFQIVLFWGFFLALVPTGILLSENALGLDRYRIVYEPVHMVGAVLFIAMSLLGLWCAWIFAYHGRGTPFPLDTATRLVILGPYRFVRNPMALSGLAQGFAVGLFVGSPIVLAYAVIGGLVWNCTARPWEERDLLERFGESYARYIKRVPCWLPTLRPYPKEVDEHAQKAIAT